jgi:cellulose synthase/poly-beta-1,6-N-acetylglucosamine synthase-like glycosyltransferase
MLTNFAIVFGLVLVGAAIVQWVISQIFARRFRQSESGTTHAGVQEKAAVIMSVRGCDPSLRDSLMGVLNQDYADYSVHIVVDHQSDQAWDFIHQLKSNHDRNHILNIHEMRDPLETCSLKCHAIVQAFECVSKDTKWIAFLDADVTPHSHWLSALTRPLEDPQVGAVTGNQWFEPAAPASIGSLVRSAWNAGSMVLTIIHCNPWAGSFAMRAADVRRSGLLETWKRSIVDDGPIRRAVNDLGLKIQFAPSLIMVNREPCSFAYVNRWVTRMLTWSRLYESTFFLSVIHAVFSNTVMIANFAVLLIALGSQNWLASSISAACLIVSGILSVAAFVAARRCAEHSCQLRGGELLPTKFPRLAAVFSLVAVGQMIYGVSCLRAIGLKQIKWREISYELKSKDDIKRLNYQPYLPNAGERHSRVSI